MVVADDTASDCCCCGYDFEQEVSFRELATQDLSGVLSHFLSVCAERDFWKQCVSRGFYGASFHANPFLVVDQDERDSSPCYQKFEKAVKESWQPSDRLRIAFHGTALHNIPGILEEGLDPKLRYGQSYGPGEYFGTTPNTCIHFCDGGDQMLVFVVVLPKRKSSSCWTLAMEWAKKQDEMPSDFVVIEKNQHQIPLGILKFAACDPAGGMQQWSLPATQGPWLRVVKQRREVLDRRVLNFQKRLERCDQTEHVRLVRDQIVRDLQSLRFDLAADLYRNYTGLLAGTPENDGILSRAPWMPTTQPYSYSSLSNQVQHTEGRGKGDGEESKQELELKEDATINKF